MSTGKGSTFEDSTELITTTHVDIAQQTTGSSMTSSWSREASFYFQCAAAVVGVVGMATNGLVLYAMVVSKQHRKHVLIFNQNLLDCASCLFLFVSYSAKLFLSSSCFSSVRCADDEVLRSVSTSLCPQSPPLLSIFLRQTRQRLSQWNARILALSDAAERGSWWGSVHWFDDQPQVTPLVDRSSRV